MADLPPLPRILCLGSIGRDVRALQRALQAAGVRSDPPTAKPSTARGVQLLNSVKEASADTTRRKIAKAAHTGYINRDEVHYTQQAGTRMEGITQERRAARLPRFADCSSFVIWCYWAANAPDPNGTAHGGWSGSILTKGREIKIRAAAVGDIAFYGRSRSDVGHVTVYVGNGRCVSHGQESGPMLYPLDYDRAAPAACSWSRPT